MDLHLKVKAGSRVNSITVEADGTLLVKIQAPPVDGKANEQVIKLLSKQFHLPQSAFEIVRGHNNPFKTVRVNADDAHISNILEIIDKK